MSTTYHPFKIALTDGQKKKLQKAYVTKTPVNLKVKPDKIGRGDELFLSDTQIARLKKRSAAGKGMVIKLSQSQIQSTSHVGESVGKGMQNQPPLPPPRTRRSPPIPKGEGMQIQPPRFYGTWEDYYRLKKVKFDDKPLSNIDLKKWCNFLRIPIKGFFIRNEKKPLFHSPCIISLDDFGSLGTHWVCCRPNDGTYEYFDSFGLPPPLEWEKEMSMHGMTHFFRNDNQIQWEQSVRCGYYCLLFLNERNKGTSFADILKMFSNDLLQNEKIVKKYFS